MIFGGGTNPGDVSIDTANGEEMIAWSHITEQHTQTYQVLVPYKLSNVAANKPQIYNSPQNYQLDSLNKFKDSNILWKTNNVTFTTGNNLLSQENQDYYNQRDQQYICRKYNGGLE